MQHIWKLAAVSALTAGAVLAQEGGIYGRIISPTGQGMAATLSVTDSKGVVVKELRSGEDGNFEISPLAAESMRFVVRQPGFREERRTIAVPRNERIYLIVALTEGRTTDVPVWSIEGTVRDEKGSPVNGATVTLRSMYRPSVFFQTKTDKKGFYRTYFYEQGQMEVTAEKDSAMGLAYTLFGTEADRPVDLVLDMQRPAAAAPPKK